MDLKSLTSFNSSSVTLPPQFPPGTYKCQIVAYDWLPYSWKGGAVTGIAYVPKLQIVDVIPTGDPDIDQEQQDKLDAFGDWTHKTFQFDIAAKDDKPRRAGVSAVNFQVFDTDEIGGDPTGFAKGAFRFHVAPAANNGVEAGFVHDVLGLSFPDGAPVVEIAEATLNKFLIAQFEFEEQQDERYAPRLHIVDKGVSAA